MTKNVYAYTAPGPTYPEYISVNEVPGIGGAVVITMRSKPTVRQGVFVCGYAEHKNLPGRCTPGDDHCNNYCNMAPGKGPMADAPLPCEQTTEGSQAMITLTSEQASELAHALAGFLVERLG